MFSGFLLSCRSTSESLGELEKGVDTLACWLMLPQHFSFAQTFTLKELRHGLCILKNLASIFELFFCKKNTS